MKKICLLLIVLLFAACKKKENVVENDENDNEKNIKGKWKLEGIAHEYYDSKGKLFYNECFEERGRIVIFDDNKITFDFQEDNIYDAYTYKNGILKYANATYMVTTLTADSMTWRREIIDFNFNYQANKVYKLIATNKFAKVK